MTKKEDDYFLVTLIIFRMIGLCEPPTLRYACSGYDGVLSLLLALSQWNIWNNTKNTWFV